MSSNTAAPAEVRTCDGEEVEMMQTKTRGHFCVLAVVCFVALVVVTVPAVVIAVKNKEGDENTPDFSWWWWYLNSRPRPYYLMIQSCGSNVTQRSQHYMQTSLQNGVRWGGGSVTWFTEVNCTLQDVFPHSDRDTWIGEWDCTGNHKTQQGYFNYVINASLYDMDGEPETNETCYMKAAQQPVPVFGRPYMSSGVALTSELEKCDAGSHPEQTYPGPHTCSERRRAASEWRDAAKDEHAAVASFARVSLELVGVGAPLRLLTAVHMAAMQEVGHAEMCLVVAQWLGTGCGDDAEYVVAPFPAHNIAIRNDPVAVALSTFDEGGVGETGAALQAALKRGCCANDTASPMTRALDAVVAEEARHAALAWSTVRWLVASGKVQQSLVAEHLQEYVARAAPLEAPSAHVACGNDMGVGGTWLVGALGGVKEQVVELLGLWVLGQEDMLEERLEAQVLRLPECGREHARVAMRSLVQALQ